MDARFEGRSEGKASANGQAGLNVFCRSVEERLHSQRSGPRITPCTPRKSPAWSLGGMRAALTRDHRRRTAATRDRHD